MPSSFDNKTVLITGGTGSFGSTMALHALKSGAAEVRIFSRDEAKQDAMRHNLADKRARFFIGDTRDKESVMRSMRGVDLVFHAAALKQVPSAEFFPLEAVKTNVTGSSNVLSAALASEVASVVCLSTDKAVYPINAMGMSKALMEKTAQAFARDHQDSGTVISVTRYGNVMMSRGSVIPLFISQIKSGGPLTVTAFEMTRFLMSLSDSVDLVEHAFQNAASGDLFVRKAPASTVEQLVQVLLELFDGNGIEIRNIGFRHGEKLFESLLSVEERVRAQDLGAYFRVPLDERDLNYEAFFESGQSRDSNMAGYHSHNAERLSNTELRELLLSLPAISEALE